MMIRIFIFLISIFLNYLNAQAQDETLYFAANYAPVRGVDSAIFRKEISHKSDRVHIIKTYYRENGDWEKIESLKLIEKEPGHHLIKKRKGFFFSEKINRFYSEEDDGYQFRELMGENLLRKGSAKKLIPVLLEGELIEYYPNGNVKSVSIYHDNQLVTNKNWLKNGKKYINDIFYSVDSDPSFKPGYGFFRSYILSGLFQSGYNISMVEEEIILGWVIMENGEIRGVHRVEGKLLKLSELLIELVETLPGEWEPALLNGEPVRYYMTIPFNFKQDFEQFDTIELNDGYLIWD